MMRNFKGTAGLLGLALLGLAADVVAQVDYGNRLGRRVGGRNTYSASGVSIEIGSLDPTVQRWYMPQELFSEYGRRQWEQTNYSQDS